MIDGNERKDVETTIERWYNNSMKKEVIKIKVNQMELRNEFHFNVQRTTRMNIFRDKTKYCRRRKHRNQTEW